MMKLSLLLFLLCCCSQFLPAQTIPAREVPVYLPDGEAYDNSLNPLYQDARGFLWLDGYQQGIGCYDGESITVFGADQGVVITPAKATQDSLGYLWIGGFSLDGSRTNLLRSNQPLSSTLDAGNLMFTDSLPGTPLVKDNTIDLYTDTRGSVWASQAEYLIRYTPLETGLVVADTLLHLPGNNIIRISNEFKGYIYVADVTNFTLYSIPLTATPSQRFTSVGLPDAKVDHLNVDAEGSLWMIADQGLYVSEGPLTGGEIKKLPPLKKIPIFGMKAPLVRLDDSIFLASDVDRLVEFNKRRGAVQAIYNHTEDLDLPALQEILPDNQGNIWIGTVTGLAKLPADYRAYATPNAAAMGETGGIPANTTVVTAGMGGPDYSWLMIGTSQGIFLRSEEEEWITLNRDNGLLLPNILGMSVGDSGSIWAASNVAGINLISPADQVHPSSKRPTEIDLFGNAYVVSGINCGYLYSPHPLRLKDDTTGEDVWSIWGGNQAYMQVLTASEDWLWFNNATGVKLGGLSFFAQDKQQRILAASNRSGLFRTLQPFMYQDYQALYQNAPLFENSKTYRNLPDTTLFEAIPLQWDTTTFEQVAGMQAYQEQLWVGVQAGILVLDLESLQAHHFIALENEDNQAMDFAFDPTRNRVWAATRYGIAEISLDNATLIRMITEEDGLKGESGFSPQCITVDQKGTVFFATNNGLAAYHPELAAPIADDFPVYVRHLNFTEDAWGQNELFLRYAALDLEEAAIVYQTKLEGYDRKWSADTKKTNLRYTNLPAFFLPRTYRFRVRAQTDDGRWVENAAAAEFTVSPPWYFRWWAVLIGLALVVLAIRRFMRFQLEQQAQRLKLQEAETIRRQRDEIQEKNDQNELLLKEIHHRVKNNLEVVSSLLELQSAGLTDSEARDAMQAGQSRVQSMGLLHQKLYQGDNLAAIEMKDYFQNLAASLLETYEAEERIKVKIMMEPLELDVDTAVPLGLIVNELLTNTIKYAFESPESGSGPHNSFPGINGDGGGAVEVGLSKEGTGYLLRVKDNGSGKDFDVPATGTGFGSRLVGLLSRQLGGTLREVNEGGLKTELRFN